MTARTALHALASRVRHHPALERADTLWNVLRGPYQRLLDASGGAEITMAGRTVRLGASSGDWETYEPESVDEFLSWIEENPGSLILDIGCAIGLYSGIALSVDPTACVVAVDGDINSLVLTRNLCKHSRGNRVAVLYGLLTDQATHAIPFATAEQLTSEKLAGMTSFGPNAYVTLNCAPDIPRLSIDHLFPEKLSQRAMLKVDVEGAELLVLRGASTFIERERPAMLLSIHPEALPGYGHSVQDVSAFLESHGYTYRLIADDHEQHWLCHYSPSLATK